MRERTTSRKAVAAPAPAAPPGTLAALIERTKEIEERRRAVVKQVIELEDRGTVVPPDDAVARTKRDAAVDLLNGSVAPVLDKMLPALGDGATLKNLRAEVATIDAALALANRLYPQLAAKEADARLDAHQPEIADVMNQIALALVSLERCLQARDKLALKINYVTPILGEGYSFGGRLRHPASQAYRFLALAVSKGWLSEKELSDELIRARKEPA